MKKKRNTIDIENRIAAAMLEDGTYPRGLASELAREYNLHRSRISKIALSIDIKASRFKVKEQAT